MGDNAALNALPNPPEWETVLQDMKRSIVELSQLNVEDIGELCQLLTWYDSNMRMAYQVKKDMQERLLKIGREWRRDSVA